MSLDLDEFMSGDDPEPTRKKRADGETGGSKWDALYDTHSESGGAYGGRNNALLQLAAFFRAKSVPYPVALSMAYDWNSKHCEPPQPDAVIEEMFARKWHEWQEGEQADAKPEDYKPAVKPKRVLMSVNDLLDLAESGHGLEWLIPNVFVKGGIHFVSSPAAGAKSWLMLDLARCVVSGLPWLDQFEMQPGAVLYIDEEMGENNTSTRIKKLDFQRDLPFYYIGKQGLRLNNAADRAFIIEAIETLDIKLICLDTLTGLIPGLKENENEHVSILRSYFNNFTTTGATLLVAHHDRKGGQGDSNTPHERMAGGRDFGAMADMAYGIDKRGSVFHLSVTKNRFVSEDDLLSIDFTLEDNEDKTRIELKVLSADERVIINQRKTESTVEERILDCLSINGAQNTRELCAGVEGSPNLVTQVAKRMAANEQIIASKEGQQVIYSLTTVIY